MQDTSSSTRAEEPKPIQMVLIVEGDASIGKILVQLFTDETPYSDVDPLKPLSQCLV